MAIRADEMKIKCRLSGRANIIEYRRISQGRALVGEARISLLLVERRWAAGDLRGSPSPEENATVFPLEVYMRQGAAPKKDGCHYSM
jgi:hypothetical protein